jgi:DNA-binding transcriptional MerR regulator
VTASTPPGQLLSIGRFARETGLSIGALRHYDEHGLLKPAAVDTITGYRYYRHSQIGSALLIGALRDLDVPLASIATVLAGSVADRDRVLAAHLARTEAMVMRLQRLGHRLRALMTNDHDLVHDREKIMPKSTFALDPDDERRLASSLFNHVWDLLEKPDRSTADDDAMIHAAHASRHHWGVVGTPMHAARGEWQCSRVYAVLGRFEPARHHAERCLNLAVDNDLGAFDVGIGHEAIARAYRVTGDTDQVATHVARAAAEAAKITEPEDRKILEGDLADLR